MAEILCFYSFPENKNNETGYFVIEHNVTYDQLVEFVKSNGLIDETYKIFSQNNEEIDEEKLKELVEDSESAEEPTISLLFKKEAPLYPSLVPEPEPEVKESPIGPTIRQIMAKIGMKFDEDVRLEDVQQCMNAIPFPYCFLVKGFLAQEDRIQATSKCLLSKRQSYSPLTAKLCLKKQK